MFTGFSILFFNSDIYSAQSATVSYSYQNPLVGEPTTFGELVMVISNYVLNIAIPITVIIIIYGGFRMLMSGGKPEQYKKGLDALKYASYGLAIMLIAKGFVSLVKSVLSVK